MSGNGRIILAGGSGFLGRSLAHALVSRGYEMAVLSRQASAQKGAVRFLQWDGKIIGDWAAIFEGARAIVNLTGKSVNCRYTPDARAEILASRVDSVHAVGEAIARCAKPPPVLVQASSLAIYGNSGERICTEDSPHGSGFGAKVCEEWEGALNALPLARTRKVALRIGFALKRGEGALRTLEKITRLFLGGTVGDGCQYISWIHIGDLEQMFVSAIEEDLEGPFNATGPTPTTNADFMAELRRTLHRPWSPPVPKLFLRLGAWAMRTEADLALNGVRCLPQRFLERGFRFDFTDLGTALADLYGTDRAVAA
jgi:uncharacterized protein (TIGR01777 family)